MYYYLQENTTGWQERKLQDKLKKLVGQFGIAGETVSPSPARTIDELVAIGFEKNYSTFVGVGSDPFLNKLASSIINQSNKFNAERVVLGLVPTDLKGYVATWLGLRSVDEAAAVLKSRKIVSVDVALIEPSKYFIAPLEIRSTKPFMLKVITSGYELDAQATGIAIDKDLKVAIAGVPGAKQIFEKIKHFFTGGDMTNIDQSILRTNELKIETLDSLPVYLGSEIIAKTPVSLKIVPQVLNLIIERGMI